MTKEKRAALWGQDATTAVDVPTHRSQQRLKTIVKAARDWDEDIHTLARPVDAILPAAAFREDRTTTPAPALPPSSAVRPPPLPLATAAPSTPPLPLAKREAASPSQEARQEASAAAQPVTPNTNARRRPSRWALVCLATALLAALGYAGVTVGQVLSQRAAIRHGAALTPAAAASDSGWARALADRIEALR